MRRVRRIYPLLIVAMFYSYLVVCLAERRFTAFDVRSFLGNLAMLQDLKWVKRGTWFAPYQGNSPLWSLSYEWWFYLLFFLVIRFVRNGTSKQKYLVFAVATLAFLVSRVKPNQACLFLVYFPIWWCGAELSREFASKGRITFEGQLPSLLILLGLAALWTAPAILEWRAHTLRPPGFEPLLQLRHTLAGFVFLFVGILWSKLRFVGFSWSLGPFSISRRSPTRFMFCIRLPCFRSRLEFRPKARERWQSSPPWRLWWCSLTFWK